MKRLLSLTMIATMVTFAIVSCKDDFNEQDFLETQARLKKEQAEHAKALLDSASEEAIQEFIDASNEAGDLLAVTLVIRENGNALAGVDVTLFSGTPGEISSGRAKASTKLTTDATGTVVFDRVTIGRGTASFSKNGYVSATAEYDFGTPDQPIQIQVSNPNGNGNITRYVPPVKRHENAAVEMISASPTDGSTATIKGRVTIENDLTNLTPEIPSGIVIRANLTSLVGSNQGFFTSYTLSDNSTLGRATINSDGTYTMQVPATASGTDISFIIPNIEGSCRMAVNAYENGSGDPNPAILPIPEYRNVPTSWGPNYATSNDIPVVAGARIIVPPAPALGSGLSFTSSPVGRSLQTGTISESTPEKPGNGDVYYRITSRGAFTVPTIPSVTIAGGGGTGATATAIIQTLAKSITVTNRGKGYDAPFRLQLRANHDGNNFTDLSTTGDINPVGDQLPLFFDLEALMTDGFGLEQTPLEVPANTTSISVGIINGGNGTGGELTSTIITDLKSITINSGGHGYSSAPSISLSGGGASVAIVEFPVHWEISPVMGTGAGYAIVPDFSIIYPQSHSQFGSNDINVTPLFSNGTVDGGNVTLRSQLTVTGGDIVKKFPRQFRSTKKSHGQPSVVIKTEEPQNASFTFPSSAIDAMSGKITDIPTINSAGNGYNFVLTGQIVPTINGAPGSGGTIQFNYTTSGNNADYNSDSMEWQFEDVDDNNLSNLLITNQGSGYLPNLNRRTYQIADLPVNPLNVQAGKTYIVNYDFGTGFRSVNFD